MIHLPSNFSYAAKLNFSGTNDERLKPLPSVCPATIEVPSPLLILVALPADAFSTVKDATFFRTLFRGVPGCNGDPICDVAPITLFDRHDAAFSPLLLLMLLLLFRSVKAFGTVNESPSEDAKGAAAPPDNG